MILPKGKTFHKFCSLCCSAFLGVLILFISPNPSYGQFESDTSYFDIGGALRYNLFLTDFGGNITTNDRQFTFDVWRLGVDAAREGIRLKFEYRFYPTYSTHFIHHGWFGTALGSQTYLKLGVTKVPFGNLPYTSNSWWFSTAYYLGLEDDYDIGLSVEHDASPWNLQLAYFMQAEPNGPAALEYNGIQRADNTARYSYDVVQTENQSNEERSQLNGRVTYEWTHKENFTTTLGGSFQYEALYNDVLKDYGDQIAYALHADGKYGRFQVKAEYARFAYDLRNDAGDPLNTVQMGAYGFGTYPVAAEASLYILGIAYELPLEGNMVDKITLYNDFAYVDKQSSHFVDTRQNTLGFSFGVGDFYAYIDWAAGQNHPWLNDNFGVGLGSGRADPRWNSRFNINLGYYF